MGRFSNELNQKPSIRNGYLAMTSTTRNNREIFARAVVFVASLLMLFALAACSSEPENQEQDSVVEMIVLDEEYVSDEEFIPEEEKTVPEQSMSEHMRQAYSEVDQIVSEYDDSVAVSVIPLDGSPGFSINGEKSFVSASMIKLLILADYLQSVEQGAIDPDGIYTRTAKDVVGGTGVIQNEASGTVYSYDDLARHMIMYSDNTATNVLIDMLGMDSINKEAVSLGLGGTDLNRKMMELNSGVENHISADDAAFILVSIANHTLASKNLSEKAESYLLKQTDSEGIARGLPAGVEFGHKTGSLDFIRHDGGIVYSQYPYVIVVLTELDATSANSLMSKISNTVYKILE